MPAMSPLDKIHLVEAYQENIQAIAMIGSVFLTFFTFAVFSISLHYENKDKEDSHKIIQRVRRDVGMFFIALFLSYLAAFFAAGLVLKII